MSGDILVRKCETLEEFHGCVELQRQIWGEADLEVEPVTMFVVAAHTGGQALGAFAQPQDRKSTPLNSSHGHTSDAVFYSPKKKPTAKPSATTNPRYPQIKP